MNPNSNKKPGSCVFPWRHDWSEWHVFDQGRTLHPAASLHRFWVLQHRVCRTCMKIELHRAQA